MGRLDGSVEVQIGKCSNVEAAAAFLEAHDIRPDGLLIDPEALSTTSFVIALHSQSVVGLARGSQAREAGRTGASVLGTFHVNTVFAAPEYRRLGVGRTLLRELLTQARAKGFISAQLWVHTENFAARNLYEGFGFLPVDGSTVAERAGSIERMVADLRAFLG